MTFTSQSLSSLSSFRAPLSRLMLAGLLATAGVAAIAQTPATAPAASGMPAATASAHGERMGRHDPAKMQARVTKRLTELKAKLKITPAQEGAWTTFSAAMQPPAAMGQRMGWRQSPEQRAEMARLITPERIDKMRALRTERMTEMNTAMDKRGEATKAFYAALTPEQQKVFDAEHAAMRGGRHEGGHHGGMERRKS
ncbi:MAG: hypothetical protein B7X59_03845 [Polaromonas sp. 39-63-203]|jgi:Spy/CpxP family protein refolding chaperone|uniref:Spy/CpxP family protein refolding chaperone n=1 Tax=Polaromonas sp. TaxID=1869339 RepID=UPI000BD2863D|nr:Spy/CpxP family protein refolding chaperone [Polaromonas sp.]OYY53392.1 MAG: hypothetical protein B7Y54_03185 [Polaromonas sp. 35-63-240]OYZ00204.1 MAG: hypothetical protein B7Y42_04865 [Polaromonas sp. 28-63-22]OYZ84252.1 MAG: hypothetical protein B7Y03_04810 [Polaromonas sp. 24-62-144]OZA99528.1 MAG: hypothetical protein B7X59_03845 [Polaromonas sp. 39-63-203]HQS30379.1 Spy/CpxP family protein refolding chaperone [Polaromonas sp.]